MKRNFRSFAADKTMAVVFVLLLLASAMPSCGKKKAPPPRTAPVVAATVAQKDVPLQIPAIGNVETINAVSIKALVGGEVTGVFFKEGQDVKKGDLLFQIDPRPYDAALKQGIGPGQRAFVVIVDRVLVQRMGPWEPVRAGTGLEHQGRQIVVKVEAPVIEMCEEQAVRAGTHDGFRP